MNTPAAHVQRLLRDREIQALRLIMWTRLIIVCIMGPLAWLLSQQAFDRFASLFLLGIYGAVTAYWAWCLRRQRGLRAAGLTGALFDVVMLGTLLWIWYTSLGGGDIPPGLVLKSSLTELSLFFIVLNAMTLRAIHPLVVTVGALAIHLAVVVVAMQDGRSVFTASYLRGYTSAEIAGGRVTTGITIVLLAGLVLTLLAWQARRMIVEAAELQKNNDQLARYFSPGLVNRLTEQPELFNVGGERRDMSFLFTDLAGFTRMVESGDPARVMKVINGYLDAMIQTAYRFDGTVDKIVGDAVRVFFGAPVDQPDHADRAVACAAEMRIVADRYREGLDPGLGFGRTRIGVNSGPVIVGNFGGDALFDYTAHGDAINIAARLEAANKIFDTDILVSGETVDRCRAFRGRPVGELVLRGISRPLVAYLPETEGDRESGLVDDYLLAYRKLVDDAPGARRHFKRLSVAHPGDPLVAFHHCRLEAGGGGNGIVIP